MADPPGSRDGRPAGGAASADEPARVSSGLDDRAARWIFTPLLGVGVPNLAGMINHSAHSLEGLAASYAWFIGVAFITWEGNLRLYLSFQDRTAWLTRPWHRVRLLSALVGLFTVPFTVSALALWAGVTEDPAATWRSIGVAVLAVVAAVVFVTHVYETVFLVREWESDRMRNERLQRENAEAELDALRSEVDPHTLFNSLNALTHLVEQGSPEAPRFAEALARSYRYLLRARGRRLVPLGEELALLDHFVALVNLRYAGAIRVVIAVDRAAADEWTIPPVVLPELLENAVKHNQLTADAPLDLDIHLEADRLTVSNPVRPRPGPVESTGVGLHNLARRFRLAAGTAARWGIVDCRFVVTLPLVGAAGAGLPAAARS
jgi:hypothetical protein